jgi:hypothetical protein
MYENYFSRLGKVASIGLTEREATFLMIVMNNTHMWLIDDDSLKAHTLQIKVEDTIRYEGTNIESYYKIHGQELIGKLKGLSTDTLAALAVWAKLSVGAQTEEGLTPLVQALQTADRPELEKSTDKGIMDFIVQGSDLVGDGDLLDNLHQLGQNYSITRANSILFEIIEEYLQDPVKRLDYWMESEN